MKKIRQSLCMLGLLACSTQLSASFLEVTDSVPSHIHPPGEPFTITLENKGRNLVELHWVDHRGQALSTTATLPPGEKLGLQSPSDKIGYYGLRTKNQQGLREIGFAILPPRSIEERVERPSKSRSKFGMVHTDNQDPYMDSWTKTATWLTHSAPYWAEEMENRRKFGTIELPIISGGKWESDDIAAISQQQLSDLKEELKSYFSADSKTTYWELGIEENISQAYYQPFYWKNLLAKVKIAQVAAKESNQNIRFVYQIAGVALEDVEKFLKQPVSRLFHVLSLHPYPWPDFKAPDEWLPQYLDDVKKLQEKYKTSHVLWMTEMGAPQHINPNGGMFNFGRAQNVRGHSRREASRFMARFTAIALHKGVEKIFWYNYQDRDNLHADPENFFGLKDYDGFLKPSYLTWHLLSDRLHNAQPDKFLTLSNRLQTYRFTKRAETCAIAWSSDITEYEVSIPSLLGKQVDRFEARDMTGGELTKRG